MAAVRNSFFCCQYSLEARSGRKGSHEITDRPAGLAARPPPVLGAARILRVVGGMPTYKVNRRAMTHARRLIDARQYVLNSDWGEVQPRAEDENRFLKNHSWDQYAGWHLGLTEGAEDDTKARYAFVFGDLRRIHRTGIIACLYRAAEWRHKAVEQAAYRLLQYLDQKTGLTA
jgi:hypothetical protein